MSQAFEKPHFQPPEGRAGFRGGLFRMNGQNVRNDQQAAEPENQSDQVEHQDPGDHVTPLLCSFDYFFRTRNWCQAVS